MDAIKKQSHKQAAQVKIGAIYIRVSTDKQEELSPDAQLRLLLDYAKKNNIVVPKDFIYTENGISGRHADKRPEFLRMISTAKSPDHPVDTILVWKFSRFARNQEESIVYKSMLKKDHVDVVSVSEPLIDGPFGTLIERIIEWMDEYYSIRLSGEVMRGMTEKAMRGGYQATTPLGYDYNGPKTVPTVNKKESVIVRFIFDSYLAGLDFSTIARRCNDLGYRTKRGNRFELRVIKYILKNPFYIGKIRWNRAPHSSYHENSEDEIIIADGLHEPLISDSDFEAVQERIKREFRPIKRKGVSYARHWLVGLLKCGYCGATLAINKSNNFQCYKYAKGLHDQSCSILATRAEASFLDIFHSIIESGEIDYQYHAAPSVPDGTIVYLNDQLTSVEQKAKRIKAAYQDGIDTLDEYRENKKLVEQERASIIDHLKNTPKEDEPVDQDSRNEEMLNRCKHVYDVLTSECDTEIKASALRSIVESITYKKDSKTFYIIFYLS